MPSVYELAQICSASYDNYPQVDGWETLDPIYNFINNKGFFAAMFRKGEDYVMAFRGTDDFKDDLVSDATLALGFPPQQFYAANQALNSALSKINALSGNVCLTGHSLGGGLAAIVSAKGHNLPVVTFNSPGMFRAATLAGFGPAASLGNYITNRDGIRSYINTFQEVLHIRSEGDLVSVGTGRKIIGKSITLANPLCPKPEGLHPVSLATQAAAKTLCAHSMDKLKSVIQNIPEFHNEITW